jgi:molybdopterin-binding protein
VYGVLPEDVLVSAGALDRTTISARNVLPGDVRALEPIGHETLVRIRVDGSEWRAKLTAAAVSELGLAPGKRVWIAVKTHAFRRLR